MQVADTLIDTKKIAISKACAFRISAENPTNVAYKNNFLDGEPWNYCNVIKKGKTILDIKTAQFQVVPAPGIAPVSYTHLDVYKRQAYQCVLFSVSCRDVFH